jgi:hypothetical protein
MATNLLESFRQQQAKQLTQSVQFNRWSRVLIEVLIREQEEKLLASDLPVDEDETRLENAQ